MIHNIKKNRYCNRKKVIILLFIIVLLLIIIFFKSDLDNVDASNIQVQNNQTMTLPKLEEAPIKKDGNAIVVDIIENKKNTIIVDISESNKNTIVENEIKENETGLYDYSKPVPKSKEVGLDYFKDTVFIGDSRTEGFILNNGLTSKTISYTSKGLQVNTIFTDKAINMDGKKVTIMEALKNTSFSKVYIMLGINETGWIYSDLFIKKYAEIIDEIRNINPSCTIYVQSILPVSEKVSNEHEYIKNSKIDEYNSLIKQMANDKKVYYINVKEIIENQNGALPDEAATDGIHLVKQYCEKWLKYLTNHIVD